MKAFSLLSVSIVAITVAAPRPALAQQQRSTAFDHQIRAAATLESSTRSPIVAPQQTVMQRPRANAPLIGAVIGAVALPAAIYLTFHDRDSGPFTGGAILLFGAIGAFLGYMAGLIVRGGW